MREKLNDWDINPNNYLKDENNNFILKKDGTPKKKTGRPTGSTFKNKLSDKQAYESARKSLKQKKDGIEKLEKALETKRQNFNRHKKILSEIESTKSTKHGKITTEKEISSLPP